jgi:hypothetical protein
MERTAYYFVLEYQGIPLLRMKRKRGWGWVAFSDVKNLDNAVMTHYENIAKKYVEKNKNKSVKMVLADEVALMLAEDKLSRI